MKILIIGGMGVIGGAITEAAVNAEYQVVVLSRRAPFGKWNYISARYIQGDWKDENFAENIVKEGFDVIVDTQIFDEQQMARSLNIVNGHCKQFIYISTDSVYARPNDNLSEDQEIQMTDIKWEYGVRKRKAELYLLSCGNKYSFDWTVIRPTLTFGDTRIPVGFSSSRGTYTLIDRIANKKPGIRFDDGKSRHSLCHSSIFGNALIKLFLNEKSYGRFYHIADDCDYSYDDIFDVIENIVGEKGIYVFLDARSVKKYNSYVYEEMVFDKNPEFTLDNKNIKAICPTVHFHVELEEVMKETITNLLEIRKDVGDDLEYNMLTDILLLKNFNQIKNQSSADNVRKYLDSIPYSSRKKIESYGAHAVKNSVICGFKKVLRPIKKWIIKSKAGR